MSKWVLRAHSLTHQRTNPAKFQCNECGRGFTTKGTLNRHLTSHSDSRPFLCPYCHKSFKTYSVCKKHVRTHTNEVIHSVRYSARPWMSWTSVHCDSVYGSAWYSATKFKRADFRQHRDVTRFCRTMPVAIDIPSRNSVQLGHGNSFKML